MQLAVPRGTRMRCRRPRPRSAAVRCAPSLPCVRPHSQTAPLKACCCCAQLSEDLHAAQAARGVCSRARRIHLRSGPDETARRSHATQRVRFCARPQYQDSSSVESNACPGLGVVRLAISQSASRTPRGAHVLIENGQLVSHTRPSHSVGALRPVGRQPPGRGLRRWRSCALERQQRHEGELGVDDLLQRRRFSPATWATQ